MVWKYAAKVLPCHRAFCEISICNNAEDLLSTWLGASLPVVKTSKPWDPGVLSRWNLRHRVTMDSFSPSIYPHLNPLFAPKTPKTKFHSCRPRQGFLSHQIFDFRTAHISPMINTSYEGNLWNQILSPTVPIFKSSNLMPVWLPPTLQPGDRTLQLRDPDHHHPVPCHWRVEPWWIHGWFRWKGVWMIQLPRSIWISAQWKLPFLNFHSHFSSNQKPPDQHQRRGFAFHLSFKMFQENSRSVSKSYKQFLHILHTRLGPRQEQY